MQVGYILIISWAETFSRTFSNIKKYVSLLAPLIISETWQFHLKISDVVIPDMWFGQQVQVPWSWRLQRRTGVGSLEVNNQFFITYSTYLSSTEDFCKQTTALMLLQRFGLYFYYLWNDESMQRRRFWGNAELARIDLLRVARPS